MAEITSNLPDKCKDCALFRNVEHKIEKLDKTAKRLGGRAMVDLDEEDFGSLTLACIALADDEQVRFEGIAEQLVQVGTDGCPGTGNKTARISLLNVPKICRNPDLTQIMETNDDLKTLNIIMNVWDASS